MIRGIGTFNNNAPLYIVDGMYMDNINFLNPNDIESIDVLKMLLLLQFTVRGLQMELLSLRQKAVVIRLVHLQ